MPRHGTWTETGGGNGAVVVTVAVGALILLAGGSAAAAVAAAVTEMLIVIAAIAGVLIAAAVVVVLVLKGIPAREARAAEAQAARVLAYEDGKRQRALERHQRALELAVLQGDAQGRAMAAGVAAVLAASQYLPVAHRGGDPEPAPVYQPAYQPAPGRMISGTAEQVRP